MKKKLKPINQLFLFSNTLDPRIDTWFYGSVIIEQDIPRKVDSCKELRKLALLIASLDIGRYKYVTNIINYKTGNLLMVKLSGIYPVMCSLTSKSSYLALDKIYQTFEAWIERSNSLNEFTYNDFYLLKSLKGNSPLRKLAYKNEKAILDSIKQNDDAIKDLLAKEFRDKLTI
jgi:hypothetical protein